MKEAVVSKGDVKDFLERQILEVTRLRVWVDEGWGGQGISGQETQGWRSSLTQDHTASY